MATRAARTPATLAAFVLHHYDWSESSLILDLFTRELGRLAVVAKGAKRPYSQLRPVLLPFQRLQVSLGKPPKTEATGEGASEVQTLRAAEWAGGTAMLTGPALFSGFYLNELLMKLLARGDPHPALFDLYAQTLPTLAGADEGRTQAALRAFEVALLKEIGLLPDLSLMTLTQQAVQLQGRYSLLPEAGVGPARGQDTAIAGQVLIGLQASLEHGSLAALQQACAPALPELKAALRALLHYHLGSPVLRTRQVMLDVQALDRQPP
ncbi:MAG: DNA repair protein RecO [Rhizobacter sp.]|nr:DNA repair protein RecO [Rhizobacter sp.]